MKLAIVTIATVALVAYAAVGVTARCEGACQDNSIWCPNGYEHGLCPGPANVQCCPEPTPNCNGQCQQNNLPCSGSYVHGDCPGPADVQCCTGSQPSGGCAGFADNQWNCYYPSCSSRVNAGSPQPDYGCAEFAARSIAAGGFIPGLGPLDSQGAFGAYHYNGRQYDLCWTSSKSGGGILGLEDFLEAAGWRAGGGVYECSVLLITTDSYESHAAVGVADNTIDAHNNARFHVPPSYYQIDNVYNPPGDWFRNHTRPAHGGAKHPKPVMHKGKGQY